MGGHWAELNCYSHGISTHRKSWTIALSLTELGQKAAYQKTPLLKKELLTLSPGDVAEGN
jgi:hypothetical protein